MCSVLKEKIFLPFAALQDGRPCCFEGDPYDNINETSKSFFKIRTAIAVEKSQVVSQTWSYSVNLEPSISSQKK